jgi:hypothetical protein
MVADSETIPIRQASGLAVVRSHSGFGHMRASGPPGRTTREAETDDEMPNIAEDELTPAV